MFGSLGWGLAIFIVATILGKKNPFKDFFPPSTSNLLDQSKSLTFFACGTSGPLEKNYTICFAAFSVFMTFALITATRFQFTYESHEQIPLNTLNRDLKRTIYPTSKFNSNERNIHSIINDDQQIEISINQQQTQFAATNTMKLMQLIQIFMTLKNGTFLFIAWYKKSFKREENNEMIFVFSLLQVDGLWCWSSFYISLLAFTRSWWITNTFW